MVLLFLIGALPSHSRWQDSSTAQTFNVKGAGKYAVSLSLKDACSTSGTIMINARQCNCFAITGNAFTPNGDGYNDRFMPVLSADCIPAKQFSSAFSTGGARSIQDIFSFL